MTIMQALGKIDSLKHNTYSQSDKVDWLNRLDGMVKAQIIDTHEGSEEILFPGYDGSTSLDTVLLVPAPFDEMYLRWLEAQINYHNGEISQYNESITMFNSVWTNFANWYNRKHMPKGSSFRYF